MAKILVKRGVYRKMNFAVENMVFTLARPLDSMVGRIQVKNDGQLPGDSKQVYIEISSMSDVETVSATSKPTNIVAFQSQPAPESNETDEQAMDRIRRRFKILDKMTGATINGECRAMIVTGPPGVGKSFGIETQLEKASLFDKIAGKRIRFEIVKGAMTAIGLYALLYKYSDSKNVLVFDDCDVWDDPEALNILKAALDSGKRRRIWWNSDSSYLRKEGVPTDFDFNGSCIFVTNLDFSDRRSKKIAAHLEALQSRCHYLDLTITTERDKMLRIRQVHEDASQDVVGGLFADYEFLDNQPQEILDFMWENRTKMREISLRMALKIADLYRIDPQDWKGLARETCCKA